MLRLLVRIVPIVFCLQASPAAAQWTGSGYRSAMSLLGEATNDSVTSIVTRTLGPLEYTSAESVGPTMWRVYAVVNNKSADGACVRIQGTLRVRADGMLLKWLEATSWGRDSARFVPRNSFFQLYSGYATRSSLGRQAGSGVAMKVEDSMTIGAWRASSAQECAYMPEDVRNWLGNPVSRMVYVP